MNIVRRAFALLISVAAIGAALVFGVLALQRVDERPRTDDAFLTADLVHLAPEVSGRIVYLRVADNQHVEKGDVLFVVDQEPYRFKVEEAKGKIRMLEATLANQTNEVAAQATRAAAAKTAVASAQAQFALATKTRNRLEPLQRPGYISAEQLDQAKTSETTARTALEQSVQEATGARQSVLDTKSTEAEIAVAKVSLQSAERDLRLTTVLAPCRGRITSLSVAAGEYVSVGKSVFTIIDTEQWWAVGNFKETEIAKLRKGDRSEVFIMSDPSRPVEGVVSDKGFGVSPQEDSSVGGLPSVSRSLNWVRIAQRFPVRVRLDNAPEDLLRIGASVVIIIHRP